MNRQQVQTRSGMVLGNWRRPCHKIENILLAVVLATMVLLPLLEVVIRAIFRSSVLVGSPLLQHLTLVMGMLGAAIAARENRLLSLATAEFTERRALQLLQFFSKTFAVAMCIALAVASAQFVIAERSAGKILSLGIPIWWVQLALPIGFGIISFRLLQHISPVFSVRAAACISAAGIVCAAALVQVPTGYLVTTALVTLGISTLFGAPIFVTLGGAALILFWGEGIPVAAVSVDHYRLVVNPTLPAIPLFTLAGYLLAEGNTPKRIIELFDALFGHIRSGATVVAVLACTMLTAFTGASGVTILALGGLLMPLLLSAKHTDKSALGLITASGLPGVLLPPSLPLILYAIIARVSIEDMFLGGVIPAVVIASLIIGWNTWRKPKQKSARCPLNRKRVIRAIDGAKWELLLPVVAFVALFSGLATPVEAAALTAFYAFFVEVIWHRELKLTTDLPRVMTECGLLVGGIILIMGVALSFTNYLVDAQLPNYLVAWVTQTIESRWVFLLALSLFLLFVGCLMDIFSAIVVVVPLMVPIGLAFGIDPIHLGIIFVANLELGFLTPPVGLNLFFASYRFNKSMTEVYRAALPMFFAVGIGVLLVTYLPWLSTTLPALMR